MGLSMIDLFCESFKSVPSHIVLDIDAFDAAGAAVGAAWGQHLGKNFPAMTLVEVSRLIDPNAMVEIEGEAVLP